MELRSTTAEKAKRPVQPPRASGAMPRVAIIGAGLGGVGMAAKLTQAGITSFTVFEKSDGPGGVWRDNRYPGCAVDVPTALYQYSFRPSQRWSRICAPAAELRDYVQETIEELGIQSHFRYGTAVRACRWEEWQQQWHVELETGEIQSFDIVVSAVGALNVPNDPDFPGMDDFKGPMFHTARWEDEHDLKNKRVAYVGTGSTAAQAVPALARQVGQLYVFQREPGWVLPKEDGPTPTASGKPSRLERLKMRLQRLKLFAIFEVVGRGTKVGSKAAQKAERMSLEYLRETVQDPQTAEELTPHYPIFCKRPVLSSEFYPAFNEPNVRLVATAVEGFTENSVRTVEGEEYEVDVVILSTGFKTTEYLSTFEVSGRGGRDLHEAWAEKGGAYAYLGMAVPRFPNFFLMWGPNSFGANSIIFFEECQAAVVMRTIKRMLRRGWRSVEVRPTVHHLYQGWLEHRASQHPAAVGGCNNYYTTAARKVTAVWPASGVRFWVLSRLSRLAFKGKPGVPWGDKRPAPLAAAETPSETSPARTPKEGATVPLHPDSQRLLEMMAEAPVPDGPPTAELVRQTFAGITAMVQAGPELAEVRDVTIPVSDAKISARIYEPTAEETLGTIVFLHGGGWVVDSIEAHDASCRVLSKASGCRLVAVDYRVAPEHPFPTPLNDCFDALNWVSENLAGGGGLVIAGDSAGGNLAAACAIRARDEGGPEIALQVLLYPVTGRNFETESYSRYAEGYIVGRDEMVWFWEQYLPQSEGEIPQLASPMNATDLSGLAPAYIVVAEYDPLRDDGLGYAERLEEAGVPVTLEHHDDQMHGFGVMIGVLSIAEPSMVHAGEVVATALRDGSADGERPVEMAK